MADNVTLTSTTSTTIASDDVGGVQYQRVKQAFGVDGVAVDVSASNPLPVTTTFPTTQPVSGAVSVANFPATQPVSAAALPLPAGAATAAAQSDGTAKTQLVNGANVAAVDAGGAQSVKVFPAAAGGCTAAHYVSAASTNATSVKASAGQLYGLVASNVNAAARYLKLYNKATSPTVGTDAPLLTIPLPGGAAGGGIALNFPAGVAFSAGIAFAITTGLGDADAGAVAASETVVNLLYV